MFSVPRGMKDVEPDEMGKRLWMQQRIIQVLQRYGFQLMEPTPIEHLETLEAKSGPAIRDEIYWFKDKAGRDLALRFDLTVGMARLVAGRPDLPEPVKLAALSDGWRYDEPQFGRYRHFYQWDAEIFGSKEVDADGEVISLSIELLAEFGLDNFEVRISSRKLAEGYLRNIGVTDGRKVEETIRLIDKMRRISQEELRKELQGIGLDALTIGKVLQFFTISGEPSEVLSKIRDAVADEGMMAEGFRSLEALSSVLASLGIADRCLFDLSIVRGIGYYDGIVFEGFLKGSEDVGSILGGGRFDRLCSIYGSRDVPATGVAGGLERLMLVLERFNLLPDTSQRVKLYLIAVNAGVRPKVRELAATLRRKGVTCDYDLRDRPLARQLEYVDALKIPYAAIIGPKEISKGVVTLRDMRQRKEQEIKIAGIETHLRP